MQYAKISSRKRPKQERSTALVTAILDAAGQVLQKEGAQRFTTARVAQRAGVSIGSVYQYFPNKAAILFRLQVDEWQKTTDVLRSILDDSERAPQDRLLSLVRAFIRSECEEAAVRAALNDAAPSYRGAPEAARVRASYDDTLKAFIQATLPGASDATHSRAANLILTTLCALGKDFSNKPRTPAEIETYADSVAEMFSAYLDRLSHSERSGPYSTAGDARKT